MADNRGQEPSGLLIINKHAGVTSHDIVGKVRRLFGTRRVGHTGTLDPMATGVLVVLVGRAAKAAEYLVADSKKYRAVMRLGLTSDTEDITGTILSRSDILPDENTVRAVCAGFDGEIMQVPPMYSALKIGGRKLVDIARAGGEVEREARPVVIHSLSCRALEVPGDYELLVHCSSGTYIRTLCADIGKALGCGAVMAALERTMTGGFSLSESHTVAELEAMSVEERFRCLIPTEALFSDLPCVRLVPFYERLSRSGCEIYQKKINSVFPLGVRVRLCDEAGKFFALGEVRDYPDGSAIKAIKFFDLDG